MAATTRSPEQLINKEACSDNSWKLRYPADQLAKQLLLSSKLLPDFIFTKLIRQITH